MLNITLTITAYMTLLAFTQNLQFFRKNGVSPGNKIPDKSSFSFWSPPYPPVDLQRCFQSDFARSGPNKAISLVEIKAMLLDGF